MSVEKIHHPRHYNAHPSGVEAIDLCEHLGFNVGNAIKYLFRCGQKPGEAKDDDLQKARFYLAHANAKAKGDHGTPHGPFTLTRQAQCDVEQYVWVTVQAVVASAPDTILGVVLAAYVEECLRDPAHPDVERAMLDAFDRETLGLFAVPMKDRFETQSDPLEKKNTDAE